MRFTLYDYVLSASCYKVRLMASLLSVPYETEAVDFYPGFDHRAPEMLALNPAGTLPVVRAGSRVMTDSGEILAWLAQSFDTTGTWRPRPRAQEIDALMQFAQRLNGSLGRARLQVMLGWPGDLTATRQEAESDLRALELKLTDRVLAGKLWLVGDGPTIGDIACFPNAALAPDAGLTLDPYPAIRNWCYAIRALPGFITMPGIFALHERTTP